MGMTAKLPDFEEMYGHIATIRSLGLRKAALEIKIKHSFSTVIREVVSNPEYYINGKSPSMTYIEKTYGFTGLKGELLSVRESLAETTADLEHARLKLDLDKSLIDVWRTQSANARLAID